jgi:hypothetical protein
MKIIISFLFFSFYLLSCSVTTNELKIAENIINTQPDSALRILQQIQPDKIRIDSDRALYGLLLFQAFEKTNKTLSPDSIINFSIEYFEKKGDKKHLALSVFQKARMYKQAQRFEDATLLFLKALNNAEKDVKLKGKIYSELGDICVIQRDYTDAFNKYQQSIESFKDIGDSIEVLNRLVSLGRLYRIQKKHDVAQHYFRKVIRLTTDSVLKGIAYQEIGIDFYRRNIFDSAEIFLRKSLVFPNKSTAYSIRFFSLADLFLDKEIPDSAIRYAHLSLSYPGTFYNQRSCYRILANAEYLRKDFNQMAVYMRQYQDYSDSVRKIESQTKASILENLHETKLEAEYSKSNMILILVVTFLTVTFISFVTITLNRRNKTKKAQIQLYKQQLEEKQLYYHEGVTKKIEQLRSAQIELRKNANSEQRELLDKELYSKALHLNDWCEFEKLANHAFNGIAATLQANYNGITKREIIWCCLELLEVSLAEKMAVLDVTSNGLYKLKQRLAQKLNLSSAKDLEAFLKNFNTISS